MAGLTNRALAISADVPSSLIAGLQSGNRRVGESQARRIGIALGLKDEKLEDFVLQALDTCTKRVLQSAKDYPAALLNFIPKILQNIGVSARQIECFTMRDDGIDFSLANGQSAKVTLTIADAR